MWGRFVAMGDSFTEGLDDPYPAGSEYRGWADLVATRLAADRGGDFRYANLAVRGRLFDMIVDEQVPLALRMRPDLVSLAGGGNDALRRNFDPSKLIARFNEVVRTLREHGADVVLFRFADLTRQLPGGRRWVLPRVRILNMAVADVAGEHGARLVDLWSDEEFGNPALWSVDRLHLSPAGHRRVAAHVLGVLGIKAEPAWLDAPTVPATRSWVGARAADVRWAGQHLAPWLKRRLLGRSSGDVVRPKRPDLAPVEASDPR